MSSLFLSSTDKDLKHERSSVLDFLKLVEKAGGPKILNWENFILSNDNISTVLQRCLECAEAADSLIALIKYRCGSPCKIDNKNRFYEYIKKIQYYVKDKHKHFWILLKDNNRLLPPVCWVEVLIVSMNNENQISSFIFKEADNLKIEFKKTKNDLKSKENLIDFFNSYKKFVDENREGAGGSSRDEDYIWRLLWLCLFLLWLESKNLRQKEFSNRNDIISALESMNEPYLEFITSGSLWIKKLDNILQKISNLCDGEVWVWNNDLIYLYNKDLFESIYVKHVKYCKNIKILTTKVKWDNISLDKKLSIKNNLLRLEEKYRNSICINVSKVDIEETFTYTIFGVESIRRYRKILIMRPVIHMHCLTSNFHNILMDNMPTNAEIIQSVIDCIREDMTKNIFTPLFEFVG